MMLASLTEGLRGSPACLAAVLLATVMASLTYMSLRDEQARAHDREQSNRDLFMQLLKSCPNAALQDKVQ